MMQMFERLVLTQDIPGTILKAGDVGTIVEIYANGAAYEVEFFALDGSTIAVETISAEFACAASGNQILHVRELEIS